MSRSTIEHFMERELYAEVPRGDRSTYILNPSPGITNKIDFLSAYVII